MNKTISSLQNPKIKNLVKLRQRRQRDKQGLMLIDGERALTLALKNNFAIQYIYFIESLSATNSAVLAIAETKGVKVQAVSKTVFEKISYGNTPDGLLGVAAKPHFLLDNIPITANPLYVVVQGLEKPGNLGAILRSADGAGITGVIVCDGRTDLCNPNIIRASRGAFFTVPIVEASTEAALRWLSEQNIQILAATPTSSQPYTAVNMSQPTALVLGAEHTGLTEAWLNHTRIHIPMVGQVDSLNVAQSASILMFEAVRQRNKPTADR